MVRWYFTASWCLSCGTRTTFQPYFWRHSVSQSDGHSPVVWSWSLHQTLRQKMLCLTLRTLKSTIVPLYHLRFWLFGVGMVYYIYIYYYIYYNIYNNIYKSIEDIKGAKSISRWYNGTMVQYRFCGFSVSRLESGSKITRIWEIEVRNRVDRWVRALAAPDLTSSNSSSQGIIQASLILPLLRSSF